ncbi:tRNA-dihydrouridine synthase [Halalkalirubrum salinum]|uniref:tRNA-dihydrouridine synthase n=1 Tax=Halalkalirubrum salinum TaxID=2563889 RepID=UPI0010FB4926|nr:tRNA-dihydrouridine synthase [Halalkalirubrum salinum]
MTDRNFGASFAPRLAAASLSGESDAAWAQSLADHVGCAFIGGVSIDERTQAASAALVDRDRNEFLTERPIKFIDDQLRSLSETETAIGVNVRTTRVDRLREAAAVCRSHGAILEVNAHCRQPELTAIGCGESLLADTDRLERYVAAAAEIGATVGVKARAEVSGVDLGDVAAAVESAGGSILHVDAMDSPEPIATVANKSELFVIANNGVRDRETAYEYLRLGADAVSVGRPTRQPERLDSIRTAVDAWFAEVTA